VRVDCVVLPGCELWVAVVVVVAVVLLLLLLLLLCSS
jgi:hypothetical protein